MSLDCINTVAPPL